MIALRNPLQTCVASLGGKPKAVIIDDELTDKDDKDLAAWIALKECLQRDSALYVSICEKINQLGMSIDDPPTSEEWRQIVRGHTIGDADINHAIIVYEQQQHMLKTLEFILREIGFELSLFSACPDISTLVDVDLYIVDYQILQGEDTGESAIRIIRDVMKAAESQEKSPPMVVLMSKSITSEDIDKWESVALKSGYFRFNYDFLNKEDFECDTSFFSLLLLNLLQHKPVSDSYYAQIKSLRSETDGIAMSVMKDLFQVTPPEASLFKMGIETEGRKLSQEFTNLFTEHLAMGLKKSVAVQDRMAALEKVIAERGVLPPPSSHRHALHTLYAKLLYTDQTQAVVLHPEFGDIYRSSDGKYVLVINQECDLAVRPTGKPRIDRVLAVEGELRDVDVSPNTPQSIIAKPVVTDLKDQLQWFWWDMRKPIVIDYEVLQGTSYAKMWRLRFQDAEDIQHKFSFSLTKVALNAGPDFIAKYECRLYLEADPNRFEGVKIVLYESVKQGEPYIALAASDSRSLFFNLKNPFLRLEKVLDLAKFIPHADFIRKLKQEQIFIVEDIGGLVFYKSSNNKPPRGKRIWERNSGCYLAQPETFLMCDGI